MIKASKLLGSIALVAAMGATTAGCVTDPVTGERKISKAAIGGLGGAVGGYLLGGLIGGNNDRTERIIGAGIGAVAGAGVGAYMDAQERKLREQTRGTDVNVIRQGDNIILDMPGDVTFALNSYAIESQFQSTLGNIASTLTSSPSTYIDIYGHTDSTGSDSYNYTLSQQRAGSVSNFLSSRGVQQARMATQGLGETQLKCNPEVDETSRRCNRRVEIRISPVTQSQVNSAT